MSTKAVAWVLDDLQALKPGPSLVMLALADFADERNSCFPGQERLARRSRCSRRSVVRHLAELRDLGLIFVESRTTNDAHGRVRRTSNRYVLNVGVVVNTESDIVALSAKYAGQSECDSLAPTVTESDKNVTECDTGVTGTTSYITTSNSPSPHPSTVAQSEAAASPREGSPDGSVREDVPSIDDGVARRGFADGNASRLGGEAPSERVITLMENQNTHPDLRDDRQELSFEESSSLAREVLPSPMQAMGPQQLVRVGRAIELRIDAGWSKKQITMVLGARELPSQVRNLVALVMARLRDDVPLDQVPPKGVNWASDAGHFVRKSQWSHQLSDGRVITRGDLDVGLIAIEFNAARKDGRWSSDDRMDFAVSSGIERFLVS
ncbi:helix-turn-helix domain-containing protein [Corynebacterium sp. S7]